MKTSQITRSIAPLPEEPGIVRPDLLKRRKPLVTRHLEVTLNVPVKLLVKAERDSAGDINIIGVSGVHCPSLDTVQQAMNLNNFAELDAAWEAACLASITGS